MLGCLFELGGRRDRGSQPRLRSRGRLSLWQDAMRGRIGTARDAFLWEVSKMTGRSGSYRRFLRWFPWSRRLTLLSRRLTVTGMGAFAFGAGAPALQATPGTPEPLTRPQAHHPKPRAETLPCEAAPSADEGRPAPARAAPVSQLPPFAQLASLPQLPLLLEREVAPSLPSPPSTPSPALHPSSGRPARSASRRSSTNRGSRRPGSRSSASTS